MVHVLIDEWLYMDVDGQPGAYGREEVQRNFKAKMKAIAGAFIDCETKVITVPQEDAPQKEALINAAFSNEYLIQEERLSAHTFQVIGAKKEKIEDIYRYFKPVPVQTLVPYPVGIRAFLKSRSLLSEGKIVVVVDDLKTQAIVTIFEGLRFMAPRRISMRDLGYMASEIGRSQQNFLSQRGNQTDKLFIIVSNNREWLSFFMEQALVAQENIVHVDVPFPVLEGLKTARFGMHFLPPEELVREKKRAIIHKRLRTALAGSLSLVLGVCLYGAAWVYKNDASDRLARLKFEQQKILDDLRGLSQRKFGRFFDHSKDIDYAHLYFDLAKGVPSNYGIKEFGIYQASPGRWQATGIICPLEDSAIRQDFRAQGMFAKARITKIIVNGRSAQKIEGWL